MNYWLDLFTVQTYEEFQKAGAKVSGFRERQWNRCQRIQPGDKLLCYLTGISRWAGVLTVKGPANRSEDRIWEMEVFPVRLPVEADILLPPEHGIPHQTLMPTLHSPAKAWAGLLRGSPNLLKPEDGAAILEAIEKAKQTPVLRPYDKKKVARTPVTPKPAQKSNGDAQEDTKSSLCPWLPTYSQLRGYLIAIDGVSVSALEHLSSAVWGLRGTPQEPVSWDDPEQWITERLTGDEQNLAKEVWSRSKKTVNPRYMRGSAIVVDRYDLAEESGEGKWVITAAGRDLLDTQLGATEKGIDLQEGMAEIMQIVQAKPNARRRDFLPEWREFVTSRWPITFRLKRTRKADESYPLKLTHQQRESMVHATRLKNKLKERLQQAGSGTQVVGFNLKELDHLNDELGQAALYAPGPDKKRLVAVLHRVTDLLSEEHAGVFEGIVPTTRKTAPKTGDLIYQFKVTLLDIKPAIWRRIQVPDCKLADLHEYIQASFGWENYHMHQFDIDGERYGPAVPDDMDFGLEMIDETGVALGKLIPKSGRKSRWVYEYDFGDGWRHEVLFEGFVSVDPKAKYPQCVDGKRACPPEDCGGPWGCGDYLAAIADPQHERHEELLEWRGPFDPETFDAKKATKEMRKVK